MGLKQPERTIISLEKIGEINLIGDPGCDGLGAGIMTTFAKALDAPQSDLTLIVGDMVPHGSRQVYENVGNFINSSVEEPVFCLKGNHDTDYYDDFFGAPNYALHSPEMLLIVLDNAGRRFTREALDFCEEALKNAGNEAEHILFAFHYPPPNPIASNSINPPEWEEFQTIYKPYKKKVRYFIAGHVHTLAITECDGIPALVSGGAGARIEPINPGLDHSERHHRIRLFFDEEGNMDHEVLFLDEHTYEKELADEALIEILESSLNGEVEAHFRYNRLAFRAAEEGRPALAKLFKALADSEFYHGMNHFEVLGRSKTLCEELEDSIRSEEHEVEKMYPSFAAYAQEKGHSLARYTFEDALNAERLHKDMLERALEGLKGSRDIPRKTYFTCTSCGYTFELTPGSPAPGRCPVCGAPGDKIVLS
ncbi:MAG: ferritin family protein [Spirochaetales bacterium]|nr:ferritin family protein [Spirochaetales bacterium]